MSKKIHGAKPLNQILPYIATILALKWNKTDNRDNSEDVRKGEGGSLEAKILDLLYRPLPPFKTR